jgi:predicted GIY-YIG superfamily endonuclease
MLREKKDYNNTVMYKLSHKDCDNNNNFIYVGHTTHFIERKAQHKSGCNNEKGKSYNRTVYKYISENGGWNEWDMILI